MSGEGERGGGGRWRPLRGEDCLFFRRCLFYQFEFFLRKFGKCVPSACKRNFLTCKKDSSSILFSPVMSTIVQSCIIPI